MFFKFKPKPVSLSIQSELKLEKWHSLGNDFLISRTHVSPEKIKQLSDRNFGIGCDQFIVLENNTVRFFNNDGSESEMCGNALKCVGEIVSRETAYETGVFNPKKNFTCKAWCPVSECSHNGRN